MQPLRYEDFALQHDFINMINNAHLITVGFQKAPPTPVEGANNSGRLSVGSSRPSRAFENESAKFQRKFSKLLGLPVPANAQLPGTPAETAARNPLLLDAASQGRSRRESLASVTNVGEKSEVVNDEKLAKRRKVMARTTAFPDDAEAQKQAEEGIKQVDQQPKSILKKTPVVVVQNAGGAAASSARSEVLSEVLSPIRKLVDTPRKRLSLGEEEAKKLETEAADKIELIKNARNRS